jgi:aminocarboxymuconate-semialdehyde decarboxylase
MIIDAHTHGIHGKYLEQLATAGGKWAKERVEWGLARAKRKPFFTDIAMRIDLLDRYGYDRQVVTPQWSFDSNLLPGPIATQLNYARALNDNMARLMEDSKGRLIGIGTVPLGGYEHGSRQEVERAIKELGLKAISISSNLRGKPIDSAEYEPFWAQANEMGVVVYIHPADPVGNEGRSYEAEYDLVHNFGWPFETELMLARLVFSGIMERYSDLKVVSHHLGGGIPFFFGRTNETYDPSSELEDKSAQEKKIGRSLPKTLHEYFSRFYYDTAIGGSAPAIRCTYEVFGVDRLIYATDAPFGPGTGEERMKSYPDVVRSLGLTEEETRKIFADNIKSLLKLS